MSVTIQTDLAVYIAMHHHEAHEASNNRLQSNEAGEVNGNHAQFATPIKTEIEFPFIWHLGKKALVRITELSKDEKTEAKAKGKKKVCSLCRNDEIAYKKTSGGVTHLICKNCALLYLESVNRLIKWEESVIYHVKNVIL